MTIEQKCASVCRPADIQSCSYIYPEILRVCILPGLCLLGHDCVKRCRDLQLADG